MHQETSSQRNPDDPTNPQKKYPHIIFITGMHRSGSSILSRAMTTLGIHHSSNLMHATKDNEKGYWEDNDFVSFNDDLLKRTGQLWDHPKLIKINELHSLADEFREQGSLILKQKIHLDGSTCLKDPRLCNLSPFWKRICEFNNIRYHFIASYRDPFSTAKSLEIRDSITTNKALSIWCTYYINLLESFAGDELIITSYDELLNNTRHEIESLSALLESNISENEFQAYSENFLDDKLKHHSDSFSPNKPIEFLSNEIKEALINYNLNLRTNPSNHSSNLANLRNSLVKIDQELSENSTAAKFKDLFAIHYKKSENHQVTIREAKQDIHTLHTWLKHSKEEIEASKEQLQQTQAALNASQSEIERIKFLRKKSRERYAEAMKQFENLTNTIWWAAASPLRLMLSSRRDRRNLRSLESRIQPESEQD